MTATTVERAAPSRRRARPSRQHRQASAVLLSAALGPAVAAPVVDASSLDILWASGLAAGGAYLASTAKRGPLLVAGIIAIASSRSIGAAVAAVACVTFGALSTKHLKRRAFFARGAAGGAAVVSVLASAPASPSWLTAASGIGVAAAIVISGYRNAARHIKPRLRWVGLGAVAFAVAASALAAIGAVAGASKVDAGTTELRLGLAAARQGDVEAAASHLGRAERLIADARDSVDRFGFLGRAVPITGQHVGTLSAVLGDVQAAAEQAASTASAADVSDITVETGRIDPQAIAELEFPLRRLATRLEHLVDEVGRRSNGPLLAPVKDRLEELDREATRAHQDAAFGAAAAATVPDLLGANGPRRYLVLFTSPAEARGRFGFPGYFAEITMDDGRYQLGEHGTTSATFIDLAADQGAFDRGDEGLRPYLPYGPTRELRSTTIPPDFNTVARVAAELWEASGRAPVDGVLRFDPASLAALVAYTGDITVASVPFPLTTSNLERFLLFDQYVQFPYDQAPRRELLETVSEVTFERLETANLPSPPEIVGLFSPLAAAGHLHMVSFDEDGARLLDLLNIDGRLDRPSSDALFVTNINSTANKIDTFLSKVVTYRAAVEDGHLRGALEIELTNDARGSNLPFYVIGSLTDPPLPPGTNRTTVLVYTAVPASELRVDGQRLRAVRSGHTRGRWLHEVEIDLAPGETRTLQLALEGEVPGGDAPYLLRIDPGGGTTPDAYRVEVDADGERIAYDGRVLTPTSVG